MADDDQSNDTPETALKPSKSRLKREAQAALELARDLVALDQRHLDTLELTPAVRDAVDQTRRIRSHVARKRQLQYLAKQIRNSDTDAARRQLDQRERQNARATQQFHELEQWRDRLITQGDTAFDAFLSVYPQVDRQRLRQYVRTAQHESQTNKPPRAARALFRFLREVLSDSSRVGTTDSQ